MGNIERGMNMTRETVIQNILANYGQYISKAIKHLLIWGRYRNGGDYNNRQYNTD